MKNIIYEDIKEPQRFSLCKEADKAMYEKAMECAIKKVDQLLEDMGDLFPGDNSFDGVYRTTSNFDDGWQQGFWSGMLWISYEYTKDEKYLEAAQKLNESFYKRIDEKIGVDHHDLGFLYVPSCVAAYKITGDEKAKEEALKAADQLMTRYNEKGKYIQAWGKMGEQLRLIVDCMNNIPLLYWASEVTGDKKYYEVAYNHAKSTMENAIREDATTFHTFYFNDDGTPDRGVTHQGVSDDSMWARGQAWVISGLPITYRYTKDSQIPGLFEKVTNCFLNRLPKDYVPFWDMIFTDGDNEERDSSAAAIAVCGILEMLSFMSEDNPLKETYKNAVDKIMYSLYENYSTKDTDESNGVLLHATYSKPHGLGVDECNIWGCYYYMEALIRILKGTHAYW